ALAEDRILGRAVLLGRRDDEIELALELRLLGERGRAALERERAHRDLPAVAHAADDVVLVRLRALEEDLGELGVARHLLDGDDLYAGLIHRHEEVAEALVALALRVGAADDEAPLRPEREARPDLLALDHPLVADEAGLGLHVGEV